MGGHALYYSWEDLIICGVSLHAIHHLLKTSDLKRIFLLPLFYQSIEALPEKALSATWVKNRGKESVLLEGGAIELRLHSRYSKQPLKTEVVLSANVQGTIEWVTQQTFRVGEFEHLILLTKLILQWTAWALEGHIIKAGRKTNK